MSGPNPGVGDKRVVSVLNHMLLSLCSITHFPCVKQTTAILYVTCFRGKQEFSEDWEQMTSIPLTHSHARESARKPRVTKRPILVSQATQIRSHNVCMWKFFNPTPPPSQKKRRKQKIYLNIYIFCFILLFTSSSPCRKDQFAVSYNKFNCTDPGLQLGDPTPLIGLDLLTFYIFCWTMGHFRINLDFLETAHLPLA